MKTNYGEFVEVEVINPIIIKANKLLKQNGWTYDSELINHIDNLEYVYDVDLSTIPHMILNDKYFKSEYFCNNSDFDVDGLLTEKEAIELAKTIIKELEN